MTKYYLNTEMDFNPFIYDLKSVSEARRKAISLLGEQIGTYIEVGTIGRHDKKHLLGGVRYDGRGTYEWMPKSTLDGISNRSYRIYKTTGELSKRK